MKAVAAAFLPMAAMIEASATKTHSAVFVGSQCSLLSSHTAHSDSDSVVFCSLCTTCAAVWQPNNAV